MRQIQSPGIEIHEIDNSKYVNQNVSPLTNTGVLITGFADKGLDYTTTQINNMYAYNQTYGAPTNEAERYMWHATNEVISRGGIAYCAKLPYYNQSFEKYTYTTYNVDNVRLDKDGKSESIHTIPYPFEQFYNDVTVDNYYDPETELSDGTVSFSYYKLTTLKQLNPFGITLLENKYADERTTENTDVALISEFLDFITQTCYIDYDSQLLFKTAFNSLNVFNMIDSLMINPELSVKQNLYEEDVTISIEGKTYKVLTNPDFLLYYDDSASQTEQLNAIRKALLDTYGPIEYVGDNVKYPKSPTDKILKEFFKDKNIESLQSYYDDFNSQLYTSISALSCWELSDNNISSYITGYLPEGYDVNDLSTYLDNFNYFVRSFYNSTPQLTVDNSMVSPDYENDEKIVIDNSAGYYVAFNQNRYSDIRLLDNTVSAYIEIKSTKPIGITEDDLSADYLNEVKEFTGLLTYDEYDNLKTGNIIPNSKLGKNQIMIVDISRQKYQTDINGNEVVGIMPVITTAMNALYYQELIKNTENKSKAYNSLSRIRTVYDGIFYKTTGKLHNDIYEDKYYDLNDAYYMFNQPLEAQPNKSGVADTAASNFPAISYIAEGRLNRNYLKQIGIVVFAMVMEGTGKSKIGFTPIESFTGSLNPEDKDLNTGANVFIDTIVNQQSKYINVFSTVEFDGSYGIKNSSATKNCDIYMIKDQHTTSLGFYESQTEKQIHLTKSIYDGINTIFDNNKDIYKISLDLVLDGGISTIAQYLKTVCKKSDYSQDSECGFYTVNDAKARAFIMTQTANTSAWNKMMKMYDNFCKNVRQDCMFIADMIRPFCLEGSQKIIRQSRPQNNIMDNIVPKVKYAVNVSTSYGAGYCNWFYVYDQTSNGYFWCPPSVKAVGPYIYTDAYFNYWDAPAGLNRGVITNVNDVAFNPTNDESGNLYKNSWNFAVNYPLEGIVQEGQKTFQLVHTALDRVNVRRMLLYMKKAVARIARYYVYEPNTQWLRQKFVDQISEIFEYAKNGNGITDYAIICNELNNTTETIENHELHCTIAIQPIKTLEFIKLTFIAMPQNSSFSEEEILNIAQNPALV